MKNIQIIEIFKFSYEGLNLKFWRSLKFWDRNDNFNLIFDEYFQCRDAILDGTHPVTEKNSCEFAGIQCQIQFGDVVDQKHKDGFLE